MADDVTTNVGPDQQEQAKDIAMMHAQRVAERARQMQQAINDLGAGPPTVEVNVTVNDQNAVFVGFDTDLMQTAFADHEIHNHGVPRAEIVPIPQDCLDDVAQRYATYLAQREDA